MSKFSSYRPTMSPAPDFRQFLLANTNIIIIRAIGFLCMYRQIEKVFLSGSRYILYIIRIYVYNYIMRDMTRKRTCVNVSED